MNCHERGETRIRWTPRPDGLEESVQFTPGYNCRRTDMQGHGVHGMEITWLLRGPIGAVQLIFGTDWTPGELFPGHGISPDGTRGRQRATDGPWGTDPNGRGIGVHSRIPQYEGHDDRGECCVINGICYYNEGLSQADPLVPLFLAKGEQAIWDELETRYAAIPVAVGLCLRAGLSSSRPSSSPWRCWLSRWAAVWSCPASIPEDEHGWPV